MNAEAHNPTSEPSRASQYVQMCGLHCPHEHGPWSGPAVTSDTVAVCGGSRMAERKQRLQGALLFGRDGQLDQKLISGPAELGGKQ